MRFVSSERFSLAKCGKIWKNRLFLGWICPDLGKFWTGGYGRIRVYRVRINIKVYCPLELFFRI